MIRSAFGRAQGMVLRHPPVWVLPLAVSLLFFRLSGVQAEPDSAWYAATAASLLHGLGYKGSNWETLFRAPTFPTLLMAAFVILGFSVKTIVVVVRFFFVANVMLVYALGTKLRNRYVGLLASLLVLSSFTVHVHSARIIQDGVIAAFVLFSQLLLLLGFQQQRRILFLLSALVLLVAIGSEEVAAVFVFLPLFVWVLVKKYRTRTMLVNVLLFYSPFVLLLGVALWYVRHIGANPFNSVRIATGYLRWTLARISSGGGEGSGPLALLEPWLNLLRTYYQKHFVEGFVLAPLFAVSWLYVALNTIIKHSFVSVFLFGPLLFFSPLFPYYGTDDPRQSFYIYLLSYIALAYFVDSLLLLTRQKELKFGLSWRRVGQATFLFGLIAMQLWGGSTAFAQILKDSQPWGPGKVSGTKVYAFDFGLRQSWEVSGWFNDDIAQAGRWIHTHAESGSSIAMSWQWSHALYFFNKAKNPIAPLYRGEPLLRAQTKSLAPLRYVWIQKNTFMGFSESHFIEAIRRERPQYIILTPADSFLSLYLVASPDFLRVFPAQGRSSVQIFAVQYPVSPLDPAFFEIHIGPGVYARLAELERSNSKQYQAIFSSLKNKWKLSELASERFRNQDYPTWTENSREIVAPTFDDYISVLGGAGMEALERTIWRYQKSSDDHRLIRSIWMTPELASLYDTLSVELTKAGPEKVEEMIAAYKQRIRANPADLWALITLARLYQVQGTLSRALEMYQQAYILADDENQAREIEAMRVATRLGFFGKGGGTGMSLGAMYLRVAEYYHAQGMDAKAEAIMRTYLDMALDRTQAYLDVGALYQSWSEIDLAIETYRAAIEDDAMCDRCYEQLGEMLRQDGRYQQAFELYRTYAAEHPTAVWVHKALGMLYLELYRHDS